MNTYYYNRFLIVRQCISEVVLSASSSIYCPSACCHTASAKVQRTRFVVLINAGVNKIMFLLATMQQLRGISPNRKIWAKLAYNDDQSVRIVEMHQKHTGLLSRISLWTHCAIWWRRCEAYAHVFATRTVTQVGVKQVHWRAAQTQWHIPRLASKRFTEEQRVPIRARPTFLICTKSGMSPHS